MGQSGDEQERSAYRAGVARYLLASEQPRRGAGIAAEEAFASNEHFGFGAEQIKEAFAAAGEAALGLGDHAKLRELVDTVESLPPGVTNALPPCAERSLPRPSRPRREPDGGRRALPGVGGLLVELAAPFTLAVVRTEHAELLLADGTAGDASGLLADARSVFEQLGATPWLERLERLGVEVEATA